MSKRYFINNLDTPFGQEFYQALVKEDTEEGVHMATYKDDSNVVVPKGFKKILKRAKPKLSRKKMLEECDVYVYDLETADKSDIEYVCGIFQNQALVLEEQKVLIIVSSVLTWSDMANKIKPKEEKKPDEEEGDGEQPPKVDDQGDDQGDKDNDNENENENEDQAPEVEVLNTKPEEVVDEPIVYVPWEESDYKLRNAQPKYQYLKDLEDLALSLQKENLKVIVVCSGLVYGKGEILFQKHFKRAWLEEPYKLGYYGDGTNKLPTVHITDLIKMIIKVSETIPETNYVLAVDNTQERTQQQIIQGIATGVGSGWIEQSDEFFKDFTETEIDCFKIHLDAKPSNLFVGNEENPADFEWHCEKGIQVNAKRILEEFTKIHKLRPMKLLMYSKGENMRFNDILGMIHQHYRIPIITQQQIFDDARSDQFVFPQELLEDFTEYYPFIDEVIKGKQQIKELSEQMKIYYKVIKWRLSQNDCSNRGYILENFPNHQEECDLIYYPNKAKLKLKKKPKKKIVKEVPVEVEQVEVKPKQEDGDEEDNENEDQPEEPKVEEEQQPEQVEEPEEVPEEEEAPVEEEEEGEGGPKPEIFMPESLIIIKPLDKRNNIDYNKGITNYFSDKGLDGYFMDSRLKTNRDVFESLRMFIERNGRPFNYLQDESQLIQLHFAYQNLKNLTIYHTRKQAMSIWKAIVKNKQNSRQEMAQKQIKYIEESEQELEKVKQFPFRNYLIDYVVPVLNDGLVEVAHILPDDPVEFLAEYLYKMSFDVGQD